MLSQEDIDKYRHHIEDTVPLLLRECTDSCAHCGDTEMSTTPTAMALRLGPVSSLNSTRSAPALFARRSKSVNDDHVDAAIYSAESECEEIKNRSLVRVIGTGIRNHMPRLLGVLNDINGRMLYEQYKREPHFYAVGGGGAAEFKSDDPSEDPSDDALGSDSDDDDPDVTIDYDDYVQPEFRRNGPSLSGSRPPRRLQPRRSASLLSLRDSVPLTNDSQIERHGDTKGAWSVLNKMPLHLALRTYHERLVGPLNFCPRFLMKDSMMQCLSHLSILTAAVKKLVRGGGMPMQFDVVIFPKEVVPNPNYKGNAVDDADGQQPQSGQSAEDEKERDSKPVMPHHIDLNARKRHHAADDIGDVSIRLKALGKEYDDHLFLDQDRTDSDCAIAVNPMDDHTENERLLGFVCDQIPFFLKGTRHGRYVCIIDREGKLKESSLAETTAVDDAKVESQSVESASPMVPPGRYLQRRRTTFINKADLPDDDQDTAAAQKETKSKPVSTSNAQSSTSSTSSKSDAVDTDDKIKGHDLFYFFQPPKPYGDIIQGVAMAEAMHSDTLEYLLPAKEGEQCPIGARHLCGGKMLCVSFHLLSKEEIKCYLYIDQKCIRLNLTEKQPLTELMRILPHYFEDETFVPLSIRRALRAVGAGRKSNAAASEEEAAGSGSGAKESGFAKEQIEQVFEWMNRWREEEREQRVENDLNRVELAIKDDDPRVFIRRSPMGEFLRKKYGWDDALLFCLYKALRDLFAFAVDHPKWANVRVKHRHQAYFSTVDREHDDIREKVRTSK